MTIDTSAAVTITITKHELDMLITYNKTLAGIDDPDMTIAARRGCIHRAHFLQSLRETPITIDLDKTDVLRL